MFFLARKNLFAEKTRLLISIGGVAFSVLMILVVGGLYRGWQIRITEFVDSVDTNLWVAAKGTGDMSHSISLLPANLRDDLEAVRGVASAEEFIGRTMLFEHDGDESRLMIVGFNPDTGKSGPLRMVSGTKKIRDGEIIVDRAYVQKTDAALGHTITIAGKDLIIRGISTGGNMLVYQYAFVTKETAREVLQLGDFTNYYLVKTVSPELVADRIKDQFPNLTTFTKEEFSEENKKVITETFLPIIGVLLVISFLTGVAIVGLTIYTATVEKSREYGVLKAIGTTNWQLYKVILAQSFMAGAIGSVFGMILAFGVSFLAEYVVAGFITTILPIDLALVFGAAMGMAFLGAWIPTRRIAKIDPALVFKA